MTPATAAGSLYGLTRGDSTPSSFHPFGFCSSLATSRLLVPRQLVGRSLKQARRFPSFRASFLSGKEDFEVGRFIGSYGFMNVTSYSNVQSGGFYGMEGFGESDADYSLNDIERLRVQDVGEGQVKISVVTDCMTEEWLAGHLGELVSFSSLVISPLNPNHYWSPKVYPGQRAGGTEADMMAANELGAHAFLQSDSKNMCQNIQILVGGFETTTGEQWLAFRNDGLYSAADYAKVSSEVVAKDGVLGEERFWNPFERELNLKRKQMFVIKLFQGAMTGLAYMHDRGRLHQSLGPASVVLNTIVEKDVAYLIPRLRDLAFSVDLCNSPMEALPGSFSEGLWRRATSAGAFTTMEKRAFAISDDIYEAGLLLAYLAFVPFCEAGATDALSLQRLFEGTFKLEVAAVKKYCEADDRFSEAIKFLDLGGGSGWDLLQAMLNPDFRQRPIAAAVLKHPFLRSTCV